MSAGELFTFLGYAVGAFVLFWAARGRRMATEGMGYVALAALVGGVLGAKLTQWGFGGGIGAGSVLDPRVGGRTLIGGVLGGWIAVEIMKRRLGIRRSTGDLFALALPAGEAVGRIGCYLNGCCFGAESAVPWGIQQHGALRHPAQLYSAIYAAALFAVLLWLKPKIAREGDLFRAYVILFAAGRLGIEFFRHHDSLIAGLSMAQWVCLEMVIVFSVVWLLARRQAPPTPQSWGEKEVAPDGG